MIGTVKISGLEEVNKKLIQLIPRAKDTASRLVKTYALEIQRKAKRECPWVTGYLRTHIGVDFYGPLAATIEAKANYAAYVEYGTRLQKPNPFMFRAVEEVKPEFIKAVDEAFKKLGNNWSN